MTVVPFNRGGGEPPHINLGSLGTLLTVFMDLSRHIEQEDDPRKFIELYGLVKRLGDALITLTPPTQPPKGAA